MPIKIYLKNEIKRKYKQWYNKKWKNGGKTRGKKVNQNCEQKNKKCYKTMSRYDIKQDQLAYEVNQQIIRCFGIIFVQIDQTGEQVAYGLVEMQRA